MKKSIEVTSIGDINIDILASSLKKFPRIEEQILLDNLVITSGGCAANFAKALSRLGVGIRLIGAIGNDFWKDFIFQELRGVDLKLKSINAKSGTTLILTFPNARKSFLTFPGSNSFLELSKIDRKLIEGKFLHISSFFLQGLREKTKELIRYAKKKSIKVSLDPGLDPKCWSKNDELLAEEILADGVDIFFSNLREAKAITGFRSVKRIAKELCSLGAKIVVIKMGERGCFISTEEEKIEISGFKVNAIDTTGAGDVFDAAFIFSLLKGFPLKDAGIFANASAAISTLGYGSSNYPTLSEVTNFLKRRGYSFRRISLEKRT